MPEALVGAANGGGGGSRELNPLYGVVNSSKIAELGLGGQEEPKCGRKKSIRVQACLGRGQEWLQLEKKIPNKQCHKHWGWEMWQVGVRQSRAQRRKMLGEK